MNDCNFENTIKSVIKLVADDPNRFNGMLNLKFHACRWEERWAEISFEANEWCLNNHNGVHGGVTCSIMDTSMGIICGSYAGTHTSTADLSISYLRPMKGKKYIVHIDILHLGKKLARCQGNVIDEETGTLCATGIASFVLLSPL